MIPYHFRIYSLGPSPFRFGEGLLVSSAAEMLGTFVLVWHLRPRGQYVGG